MDKLGGFHTYLNAQAEEYMISNTDIRYFFDTYYDNFMHSLAWEDHLLEPVSQPLRTSRTPRREVRHVQTTSSNAVRTIRYCLNSISIR